jgi:uncharacterized protein GlcG (DUF336 family)
MIWRLVCAVLFTVVFTACGGGGSSGSDAGTSPPAEGGGTVGASLSVGDVKKVLAQAIAQANALGVEATIAVVDRVGNVLAVHQMADTSAGLTISTDFPNIITTGLDGLVLPAGIGSDAAGAIAKAVTGAYLSSEGNAFTTRTANQIVQEHFNPGEDNQPAGPLFGVQFSQLACSDFSLAATGNGPGVGPQRSPLGLSADPGGFPLYKKGTPVGGVGVIADERYSIDRNIMDEDRDVDEMIALAATFSFGAPNDRRADRITADGKTFRYSDVKYDDLPVSPDQAPAYDSLTDAGTLIAVNGYNAATISAGTVFGEPESGVRPATSFDSSLDSFVFVDANDAERYAPTDGGDGDLLAGDALTASEVKQLLASAIAVANRSRAQIRRPLDSPARVTVSIVDSQGQALGILRTRDAPVFGSDVSLQKARTAVFFSAEDAGAFLKGIPIPAKYLDENLEVKEEVVIGDYVNAAKAFIGPGALSDGTAFSDRAGGNLSRPFYPDGIQGNPNGPFSKSFINNEWSVFSTGLQLDLVFNQIINHVLFVLTGSADVGSNCTDALEPRLANGIQIFPGSVPIYRGRELIGGIGVSGDGVDQDDMIAFLGVHEAGLALNGAVNNAPEDIRADLLEPQGERLRFVQCPQTPYLDSDEQNVCSGK